jgi:hypothetical protein
MEPLLIVLVPGIVGGVLLALLIGRIDAHADPAPRKRLTPPSPSVINMARIPVNGLGGLGMLAMAATVAIFVPRIRVTVLVALALGFALGALLIVTRKSKGPLPSSSEHAGAHSTMFSDVS